MQLSGKLENILFLDVKSVSAFDNFKSLSPEWQELIAQKSRGSVYEDQGQKWLQEKASLYAEFSQIVSIGLAYFYINEQNEISLRTKAISDLDEKTIIEQFNQLLEQSRFKQTLTSLCAHNGNEFDFPFLSRKFAIHGLPIPALLYKPNQKPWDSTHLDTMNMWRFGQQRSYISLHLLAKSLQISTVFPYTSISELNDIFHNDKNHQQISQIARQDAALVAQIYYRLQNLTNLPPENVFYL